MQFCQYQSSDFLDPRVKPEDDEEEPEDDEEGPEDDEGTIRFDGDNGQILL